jgi:hypothetical protein
MRLAHVCDMELNAQGRPPLDAADGGQDEAGGGTVDGLASGEQLAGTIRWVTPPQWQRAAAALPEARGRLTIEEGWEIHFWLQPWGMSTESGRIVGEKPLFTVRFEAEEERYHWLNHQLCLAEGAIHPQTLRLQLRIYACVHELV